VEPLIKIDNVKKYFNISKGLIKKKDIKIKAVDGVSLEIFKGETIGLVGESGSGKTTIARLLLNFEEPSVNSIYFDGVDIFNATREETKSLRKRIGIVFQDPASSLNPRSTIYDSLKRPLVVNNIPNNEIDIMIDEVMEQVNLGKELLNRYPHQLSGGQQQRVSIARAIILRPDFLVLDEPTSALDVSVQAQVLNLLLEIQEKYNMTYLFISHNLSVVRYISDRIGVMYLGQLVELGDVDNVYKDSKHPYTMGLLSSEPILSPRDRGRKRLVLEGEPPSLLNPPLGCNLVTRCPYKMDICHEIKPDLREVNKNHLAACHLYSK